VPVPASSPTIPCRPLAVLSHPLIVVSDDAAGRFYNLENEDFLYEAPQYRHLLLANTIGPVRFYNMCAAATTLEPLYIIYNTAILKLLHISYTILSIDHN
jgi:hypothetical protein